MAPAPRSSRCTAWGVPLALAAALLAFTACRAREGERCVCAEDCREGFLCVASGRVLADGECSPTVGQETSPGVCLSEDEAAEEDGGDGAAEPFMDMGSKLDFQPGPPPDPETESATGTTDVTSTTSGTTDATTEATGSTGSSGGSTEGTGSTASTGGTTEASSSTGSTGGTTDATGSSSTSVGT
jgi:hypothetical protein